MWNTEYIWTWTVNNDHIKRFAPFRTHWIRKVQNPQTELNHSHPEKGVFYSTFFLLFFSCFPFIFRQGKSKCIHFTGSWHKRLEKWFIHIQLVWREFCGYTIFFFSFVACIVVVGRQIVYFLSSYHCFARTNRSVSYLFFFAAMSLNVDGCAIVIWI